MNSPEFDSRSYFFPPQAALLAALLMCLLFGGALFGGLNTTQAAPLGSNQAALTPVSTGASLQNNTTNQTKSIPAAAAPSKLPPSAFLDLQALAKSSSLDEADNVRWSLVRDSKLADDLSHDEVGVNWKALREVTLSGSYRLAKGARWSFNAIYEGGRGYKIAASVLAGGHCALATVFRAAAIKAGLDTQARPHRYPIPGFPLAETVNIWWGRDDLTITNSSSQGVLLAWRLTPQGVSATVYPD